jgi:SAM-dependent methyltransferase
MDDLEQARFRIYALEDGAVRAQALSFCLRVGLFDRLESGPVSAAALRDELGIPNRVLPALLAFCCSQGLLSRNPDGLFANSASASAFLVRTSPRYVGGRGLLFQGFYEAIRHLPESLATGMPWRDRGQRDMFEGFGKRDQRWFADGMFANAVHGGRWLVSQVDFSGHSRLLDVGGNAGGYAIAILEACPDLTATIFDLEPVRPLATERVAQAGLAGRVTFVAGSFFEDALPRGHDVVLLSSILHDWADEDARVVLANCARALEPGGTIVVTEPMLREDMTGPDHPSVSGLTMAVLGGENRTQGQIGRLLEEAGFRDCWCSEVGAQNSVVTAVKPA